MIDHYQICPNNHSMALQSKQNIRKLKICIFGDFSIHFPPKLHTNKGFFFSPISTSQKILKKIMEHYIVKGNQNPPLVKQFGKLVVFWDTLDGDTPPVNKTCTNE